MPARVTHCLQVIGPVTVRADGESPQSSRLSQPRHLALLSYLALARPRGLHARDSLVALLWPEHDQARGRQALRNALHGIRRLLGPEVIISIGEGLVGVDPAYLDCDALLLERGSFESSDASLPEPFQGFHVMRAPAFDRWLSGEAERLRGLHANANTTARPRPAAIPVNSLGPPRVGTLHDQDTYALYIRGHYLFMRSAHGGSLEDLQQAKDCFERAIALDADYAPAVAGLSNYYAVAARRGVLTPFRDTFAQTIALSKAALALDPTLAVPHVHFGVEALYLTDQFDAAGQAFAMAIVNEPSYAEGHRYYGIWLGLATRHADALHAMESAVRLEPDIPLMLSSLAAARLAVGDVDGAEGTLRRTLSIDQKHAASRDRLIRLLEAQGRFEEALAERSRAAGATMVSAFAEALTADGPEGYARVLRHLLHEQATALESRLIERAPVTVNDLFAPPVLRLVSCLAQLGDIRRARTWKMQACAERPGLARWFAALPEAPLL